MNDPTDQINAQAMYSCQKLIDQFSAHRITFEEFSYNIMIHMIRLDENNMLKSIEMMPSEWINPYFQWMKTELEPVDFMPYPGAFLVDSRSEELIEAMKQSLKPKYCRLYGLIKFKVDYNDLKLEK